MDKDLQSAVDYFQLQGVSESSLERTMGAFRVFRVKATEGVAFITIGHGRRVLTWEGDVGKSSPATAAAFYGLGRIFLNSLETLSHQGAATGF